MAGSTASGRPLVLASSRTEPDAAERIRTAQRPRLDYLELAAALDGEVMDTHLSGALPAWQRRLERALASDIAQARAAWGRRGLYGGWLSTSEKVGLPLAMMARGRHGALPHVMIAHNLMSSRKRQMHRLTGVLRWGFSHLICLSSSQQAFLVDEVGLPRERVHRVNDSVDTDFFRPGPPTEGEYLLAVGREGRDYRTLVEAARSLGLPLIVVASSLWATPREEMDKNDLPQNVTLRQEFVTYPALRDLYRGARLVVVPLSESSYAAGVNGLLEAMATGRPTIVSRTRGLEDYLADPATHRAVPPGDVTALAEAIRSLWDDRPARRAMELSARTYVETEMGLERYVAHVAAIVRRAIEEKVE